MATARWISWRHPACCWETGHGAPAPLASLRDALDPLWLSGLALLQVYLGSRRLGFEGRKYQLAQYVLLGTLFPLLLTRLSLLLAHQHLGQLSASMASLPNSEPRRHQRSPTPSPKLPQGFLGRCLRWGQFQAVMGRNCSSPARLSDRDVIKIGPARMVFRLFRKTGSTASTIGEKEPS